MTAVGPQFWFYNSLGLVAQHAHARASGPPFIANTLYSQGLPTTEYANGIAVVAATYQPSGALASYTTGPGIGGNVVTNIAQASNGIPRPWRISAQPVGGAAFDTGTFVYDGAGNITGMGSDTFTYDKRSRLCTAALSGVGTQYYGYDRYGNLITKGSSSAPCSSPTSWSANNRVPTATYDGGVANGRGNLTSYLGTLYSYDALDRTIGTTGWSYLFDGASERTVKALSGSAWTYTFRDEGKRVSTEYVGSSPTPTISRDNLFLGNLLVASFANPIVAGNGPVWSFYSSDHLGTPRLVTYVDGSQVETRRHWPYGEDLGTVSAFERVRFASMERDTEDSTYHDHARHQEFNLGRFLSVDKLHGRIGDPQTWNRYTYAANNPLKYVDRTGLIYELSGCSDGKMSDSCKTQIRTFNQAVGKAAGSFNISATGVITLKSGVTAAGLGQKFGNIARGFGELAASKFTFAFHLDTGKAGAAGARQEDRPGGGGDVYVDSNKYPRPLGGVSVDLTEAFVHENGHNFGTLFPGLYKSFNEELGRSLLVKGREGFAMAFENAYRREVVGVDKNDIRLFYEWQGDYLDAGAGAQLFPK